MDLKKEIAKPADPKSIFVNAKRSDISKIELVKKDLVISLKSGRKLLLKDATLVAGEDPDFRLVFSNNEVLTGQELFAELQITGEASEPLWLEIKPEALDEASKVASAQTGLSGAQIGLVALGLAALGGGGGGGGGGTNGNGSNTTPLSAAETAFQSIRSFADANASATPPTLATYTLAGIQGVSAGNLAAVNDALATGTVTGTTINTTAKLQYLANAYQAVFVLADGTANNASNTQKLSVVQMAAIGVDTGPIQTGSNSANRLALLNSVLDAKNAADIDTVAKLQNIVKIVGALEDHALGNLPSYNLTTDDFTTIGISGVNTGNLSTLLANIKLSSIDSLEALQQIAYQALTVTFTAIHSDTGFNTADFITQDNTLTFSGASNAADGSVIQVVLNAATHPVVFYTTVSHGVWQVADSTELSDGVYTVDVHLLDANQKVINSSAQGSVTVATSGSTPLVGPDGNSLLDKTIALTAISPDNGLDTTDFKTSATQLVLSGTSNAPDGTHVLINIDDALHYTVVNHGVWSFDNTTQTLSSGSHRVQVSLTDGAGNVAVSSSMQEVVVISSTLNVVSKTTGAISQTANLSLVFNDSVTAVAGKYISLVDESTNTVLETIEATDTNRVSINGKEVTINPVHDLVIPNTYHALVDSGAFLSSSGMSSVGISGVSDWIFHPVDPATSVMISGSGVDASNGINANELTHLTVSGTVVSPNMGVVSHLTIGKISFVSTDGLSTVEVPDAGLPTTDPTTHVWTWAHDSTVTSQLVSGKSYNIQVLLQSQVAGTPTQSVAQSANTYLDAILPVLQSVRIDTTTLNIGQSAAYTLTFSEDPGDSLSANDFLVTNGTIDFVSTTGLIRQVVFTPSPNVTQAGVTALQLRPSSFTDAVGNVGSIDVGVTWPSLTIDTQAPTVTEVTMGGVNGRTGADKVGTLNLGDKIRVTLTTSEVAMVSGAPSFKVDVGGLSKTLTYVRGSGTTALVFEYEVLAGDLDTVGGLTAFANALALNGGHLKDAAGNDAIIATPAIFSNSNALVVDGGASDAAKRAAQLIQTFADSNTDPTQTVGVAPTLQDYLDAGVTGMSADKVPLINNVLAGANVGSVEVDTLYELQVLVNAYNGLLDLGDGVDNTPTANNPGFAQYGLLGITGVRNNTHASLLGDVIDTKNKSDIDTVAKLQALADAVSAVLDAAKGVSGLTANQLNLLGLSNVSEDNLPAVFRAISNTADNGTGVDTWTELQNVVNVAVINATQSLAIVVDFAEQNTAGLSPTTAGYVGTAPTLTTYLNAGVSGITASQVRAINDALATQPVDGAHVSTTAKLQAVADAYLAVIGLADGFGNTPSHTSVLASQYTQLGVSGLDPNASAAAHKITLLNDVIDRKVYADIDTVFEIQTLLDGVSTLLDTAAGGNALTLAQLSALGFDNVTVNTLPDVIAAIQATATDGSDVDTFAKLSAVISNRLVSIQNALNVISQFAQANVLPAPHIPSGVAPTLDDYAAAGVHGVTASNLALINDALATNAVNEASVNTTLEIQALVDAYTLVVRAANGLETQGVVKPSALQYSLLGLTGIDPAISDSTSRSNLLGDVIDRKLFADIDTVSEIQTLLDAVNNVLNAANGIAGLTQSQLTSLGITGVTLDNWALVLKAIGDSPDDGTQVNTLSGLQTLVTNTVNQAQAALQVIQNYAENNTQANLSLGIPPTLQNYVDAGVQGVTADNLGAINSALATATVNAARVGSISNTQDVVNAYLNVFSVADGLDNINNAANIRSEYALIGVTGVDSASKYSLLGDVLDIKNASEVNTTVKIQAMADAVEAVIRAAAGGTDLTMAQLQLLTITGLTADNFPLVLKTLNNIPTTGALYDELYELQNLVTTVVNASAAALQTIQIYADSNTASAPVVPSGIAPTKSTYTDAGVAGVTDSNLSSINDALTTSSVISSRVNATTKVQGLVDAYNAVFTMADGVAANATVSQALSFDQLEKLGVDTIAIKSASNPSTRLGLLNNLIDGQSATGIDTVNEINQLIRIVNAIQDQSAGVTPTYTLTANDFSLIGISGVTSSNLSGFMRAIETSTDDGLQANTQTKLQQLFNNALSLNFVSISADTGIIGTDFITNDNTLTFTGTSNAKDGSVVKLTLTPNAGAAITFATTVNNGAWQAVHASLLNDGVYSVSTQLLDNNAVVIRSATPQTITVDTSDTLLPDGSNDTNVAGQTIDFTAISPDTGVSATDFKTSASVLVFSGTSTAADGAHVALSIDGVMNYTTVTNGIWLFDNTINPPLVSGLHKVKASLIDPAGNVVASSAMRDVVVDDSTLTVSSKTTGAIAQTANLELTFSDSVTARASKYITLFDSSTQQAFETIEAIDPRITIVGNTVTINPTNDLVLGKNYYATIDRGAFVSSSGMLYNGLLNITDWTFHPVDPSTTVLFGGVGVDASNGINATELANLTVTGTVSSTNGLLVTNIQITKITFTPSGGGAPVVLTTGMPAVDSNTRVWTLANNNSWTSQLVSGKNYTVSAQLEADIAGSHGVSVANSATSLVDAVAPTLVIDNGVASLKNSQSTLLTFTFSEPPTGFTQSDIVLPTTGGNPIGTLSGFAGTADPSVYTVLFTPASGIALNSSLVSVVRTNYTDAVGNVGAADVSSSSVAIDTQVPTVTAMTISGVDSSNNIKLADLQVGDKIKVSLTMSEATFVTGTPSVNVVVGSNTKTAAYASGSGTTTLVFYYTVALGDTDSAGGITSLTNALALNGGVLRDAIGNDAALSTAAIVSGTNTVVVETNANALATLADAAQNNTATTLIAPITLFARAGVTGVDLSNLSAIISALDSAAVTATQADTTAKLQNIVDAYKAVLVLADGGQNTTTQVTAGQFETLGVTGVNTTTAGATSVPSTYKASLLSNVVDGLASVAVDTVPELQALANAVTAVMVTANGTVSGASAVTKAQLDGMGITGVTDNNLADVLAAISNTPDNGSSVNTLPALQYVVNLGVNSASQSALTTISNFAADNTSSQPISGAFAYQGTVPTLRDYANAGVTGIDNNNLESVNDALATNVVDRAVVSDTAGIQAVINAYNAVFVLADGNANAGTALTALQLTKVGATIGNAVTVATNLTLLNEVLDRQANSAVDRVAEINYWASVTNAIQDSVGNFSASNALSATDFAAIGLNNVTGANLIGIRGSIAAQSAGNKVDSLSELQSLIDFYTLAPLSIALVADTGRSNSDAVTSNLSLTFGAASAGATRYYSVDSSAYTTTYTAPTTQGQHTVAIRQVSSLGYLGQANALTFTYDNVAPVGWDINTTLAGTQSTDQSYFNKSNVAAGKAIDTNMGLANEADIATITISIAGAALDAVNDKLLFGTITQSLNGIATNGTNQTIGTVASVDWSYSASNVLTLTKNGGGVFSALDVQKIESAMAFKTLANATQGNRSFTFTHIDLAGNTGSSVTQTVTVDTILNPVDLISGGLVDATETSYYIAINAGAGKAIASNMGLPTDTDITSITVSVGGVSDTTNDKFVFGTITQTLNTLPVSGQLQTIGAVAGVDWSYSAGKVLIFTKNAGGAFTGAQVQAIEKALQFQTSANATQGARTFTFGHTDTAGNTSSTATETVSVDTVAPSPVDLINGAGINDTDTIYYGPSNAGTSKAIASSMGSPTDADIAKIILTVAGSVADTTNDKLLFGTVTQTLNTTATSGTNLTIGGITGVDWSYSTSKVLTLTKNAGGNFTAAEVQTIEKALLFQTSSGATQGNRTFNFGHADAAGNVSATATQTVVVDFLAPVLLLDGTNANRAVSNIATPATATSIDNDANPASVTELNSISKLQLRVGGVRDGTNEKLVINGVDATPLPGNTGSTTVGVLTWSWIFANGTFSFTPSSSALATSAQTAALLQALSYRDAAVTSSAGVREFFISATDASGNTSAESVATMVISDGLTPQLLSAHPLVALDGNNDGIKGDQFVLTFSEAVKTSLITISALSLDNGKAWGASPSVTPIDAHTVGGTEYATSFLVNGGVNPTYNFAPNQSVLAFNNIPGYATISDSIRVAAHITIEMWAYITAFPAINNVVPRFVDLSVGGAGVQNLRMFYFNDGTLGIGYSDEGSAGDQYKGSYITSPGELSAGKWFHVAATIDSNANVVLYINGNVVSGTKGLNDSLWAVWGTDFGAGKTFIYNYVGHSAYGDGNFYGALSDLRIYDSARTASQVTSDMLGNFDTTSLQAAYLLNGNGSSGLAGKSALVSTPVQQQAPAYGTLANTITINSTNVEDISGNKAAVAQTALFKFNDTQLSGTKVGNNITGTAGNDYLAGYGGNDTLTGDPVGGSVRGADTFAWLRGDTGTDTVTDFMASDGDMISLAGILWSKGLSSSSDELSLARFLNVSQSNTSDAVLKIDVDGLGNFPAGVEKTITFTNGWNTGLNDTLVNLVSKKIVVVDYTVRSTPLVLDLNGDGVQTNAVNQGVAFDIQGTGQLSKTGWTDGHDGLLALDLNYDGIINNGTELFGSGTRLADGSQASDGFEALKQYDINQDNVMDAQDAMFANLTVWIDTNGDGQSPITELHSLMDLGVQSINLSAVTGSTENNGNLLSLVSQWTSTDGQKHDLADVLFNTHPLNTQEAMVASATFRVDLQTQSDGANYQVHLSDVLANSQQTCLITGNATQQVTFDSAGWTNTQQTAALAQHTYVLWQNGTANLLVDQQISTHIVL